MLLTSGTSAPPLPDGVGTADRWSVLAGGDVSPAWDVHLADGRRVVVKRTPGPARLEAEGLDALRRAGAPTPEVIAFDDDLLVIAHVGGPPDWGEVGAALARVHSTHGAAFGWHEDTRIASLPMPNPRHDDATTFWAEARLRPFAEARALPASLRSRIHAACDARLHGLFDHDPAPSLVHGDLWSGNVVDGRWLIDPAVHHADREVDLAMMDLFGGFPPACWDAYLAEAPLPDGWQRRRDALQLWPLLVHVGLFGAGYAGGVAQRLDALGW